MVPFLAQSKRILTPRLISAHSSESTAHASTHSLRDERSANSPDACLEVSRVTAAGDAAQNSADSTLPGGTANQQLPGPEAYSVVLIAGIRAAEAAAAARLQHSKAQQGDPAQPIDASVQQHSFQCDTMNGSIRYTGVTSLGTVAATSRQHAVQVLPAQSADIEAGLLPSSASSNTPTSHSSIPQGGNNVDAVQSGQPETPGSGGGADAWFNRQIERWQSAGFLNVQRTEVRQDAEEFRQSAGARTGMGGTAVHSTDDDQSDGELNVIDGEGSEGDEEEPTASAEVEDNDLDQYNSDGVGRYSGVSEDEGDTAVHVWTALADEEASYEEEMSGGCPDSEDEVIVECEEDERPPATSSCGRDSESDTEVVNRKHRKGANSDGAVSSVYQPELGIANLHEYLLADEGVLFLRVLLMYVDGCWSIPGQL